jgi:hypothetical protein
MTRSGGISFGQWAAGYGVPELPRFRDDGEPVRETLARKAFAITTPTQEDIDRSGHQRPWPGVTAAKISRKMGSVVAFLVMLVELGEDVATVNAASDADLRWFWSVMVLAGQVPQIET